MLLRCWLRRAGYVSQDAYILQVLYILQYIAILQFIANIYILQVPLKWVEIRAGRRGKQLTTPRLHQQPMLLAKFKGGEGGEGQLKFNLNKTIKDGDSTVNNFSYSFILLHSFSYSFILLHPLHPQFFVLFHPPSSAFIHFHLLSPTFVHFNHFH